MKTVFWINDTNYMNMNNFRHVKCHENLFLNHLNMHVFFTWSDWKTTSRHYISKNKRAVYQEHEYKVKGCYVQCLFHNHLYTNTVQNHTLMMLMSRYNAIINPLRPRLSKFKTILIAGITWLAGIINLPFFVRYIFTCLLYFLLVNCENAS